MFRIVNELGGREMDKSNEELVKIGQEEASGYLELESKQTELTKKADEAIEELGPEKIEFYKEAEAVGRGIAIGRVMEKNAGIDNETYEHVYEQFYNAITEVFGEKTAQEINEGLSERSKEMEKQAAEKTDAIKEEVVKGVTPVVVKSNGGEEAVKASPEVAKKVVEEVEAISEAIVKKIVSGPAEAAPAKTEPEKKAPEKTE